jgi:hypothetical protein
LFDHAQIYDENKKIKKKPLEIKLNGWKLGVAEKRVKGKH